MAEFHESETCVIERMYERSYRARLQDKTPETVIPHTRTGDPGTGRSRFAMVLF